MSCKISLYLDLNDYVALAQFPLCTHSLHTPFLPSLLRSSISHSHDLYPVVWQVLYLHKLCFSLCKHKNAYACTCIHTRDKLLLSPHHLFFFSLAHSLHSNQFCCWKPETKQIYCGTSCYDFLLTMSLYYSFYLKFLMHLLTWFLVTYLLAASACGN